MSGEGWYQNAIIYAIDISVFQDSDGDGWGDFQGVIERLDYLCELGVTCLWLLPFYRSPDRDNGYDVADYYHVDERFGTLNDFERLVHEAGERSIRVIMDLVVNHTSDEHPWFQASRRDASSGFRDYYVWADHPPPVAPGHGPMFPGQENTVWTYDEVAQAFYFHRFYAFEPGLKIANPEVQHEIHRVMDFWLSFPISGFRIDSASHMIEDKGGEEDTEPENPHDVLKRMREIVDRRRPGAVLLGESDVTPPQLAAYFGDDDELNMLFNFLLDAYLFLALASQDAAPMLQVLKQLPSIPEKAQWANFLRNLDELDLERLSGEERESVFRAFAPEPEMRIYARGIRRRLAPMLGGDRKRIELAFSLLFSMPGAPVVVYGDEIGMGDDLSLEGRNSVRTPMQWSAERNAGFSIAEPDSLRRPVPSGGEFGREKVNVEAQQADPDSLLSWMKGLIAARRACPEIGLGERYPLSTEVKSVFAHVFDYRGDVIALAHNLGEEACTVTLDLSGQAAGELENVFGSGVECTGEGEGRYRLEMAPFAYQWFRFGRREGGL
ncbi:MAG TPA: alpha-amylase family protein [Longimicrobiaceae bacterium]|nr:alpha-amylase family protein [Longimicrobiaceae bacterium]